MSPSSCSRPSMMTARPRKPPTRVSRRGLAAGSNDNKRGASSSPPIFQEKAMVTFLVGVAVGAGVGVAAILGGFKVQSKESWEEEESRTNALRTCFYVVMAQNAKLRVSLAAGEMTEDGKKVAAMTMAAIRAVISTESQAILEAAPNPVQEPA